MMIGALLDNGLDFSDLESELRKMGVGDYRLSLNRVDRSGIAAAKFDVHLEATRDHHPDDDEGHTHHHHSSEHRPLSSIRAMIEASGLSGAVKERAQQIFQRLGAAEAKIHNVPVEAVQFHEVGAIDSIVDIIGTCIGLEALGIERVISSPLHIGTGTFECAHGTYPVPGPATAELLRGVPVYAGEIVGEMVTPTGAAIVSTIAESYGPLPSMQISSIGYGAGTRTYPRFPNVLRAIIGETRADSTPTTVMVIEANIDDLNAQVFGRLMDLALEAGALDIFYTPVQMKKNRPGILLTLLCRAEDRERMSALIFRETTTFGLRYREEQREILTREHVCVETPYGEIRIKIARAADGRTVNFAPEYDDCAEAAARHAVALREVQMAAQLAYASHRR